ncbi:MAG TPA: M56 family metallopeptidase, partial [Candidatus Methylomirabilis sp.]|nr:M56 family metallopeptidase [Candidatus Methylomirabilis sp.]
MISDSVVRACTNLLAYLAEPAARAIALGGLAAIVLGALRVKRVPLRLFAWTTVLYGAVAIALVGWLLPGLPMRVPGAATIERIVAANQRVSNAVRMMDEFVFARRMKETQEAKETHAETGAAKAGGFSEAAANQALLTKSNVQLSERQSGVEFRQSSANPAGIREADRRTPKKATANSSLSATEGVLPSASLGASGMTAEDAIARPPAAQTRAGQALPLRTTHAERTALTVVDGSTQGGKAAATNASSTAGTGIPWVVVAAGIYAAIALLLLGRLLLGLVLSHRLARLSEKISDGDAVRKLRFRAYASGLESVPQMAESELVSVPATLNVFRPVILLPAHWREWDEAKLDAILAHEVSHVARRDSLTQRISLIHRAIFWFSPLAWWLDRRLNELAEEASDEAALGAGADKNRYAEMLLGFFADLEAASGRVWWQGVSMASDGSRAGHAEKRVERILSWGGSISMKKSLAVALVAVAAPVIFLAAAVHPVIARAQDKTQDDSKNVIMPGGPKAPALPNAPKGGVAGGVVATAPSAGVPGGVNASAPAAATIAGTPAGVVAPEALVAASTPPTARPTGQPVLAPPTGGVVGPMRTIASVPSAQPALMPVPGAGENPPIVPGPIANGPVTPAARADYASNAPVTAVAPMATQEGVSSDMQDAERQVRDAQKEVKRAESAMPKDEDAIAVAQKALSDAEAQLAQARAAEQSVREAKAAMETAQAAMKEAQEKDASITYGNFNTSYGPRYVMMSRNSNEV